MRNRYQRMNQPSAGFEGFDNQTLADHAYEAEITLSQRPKLIKVALMQELRDAATLSKRQCRKAVKATIFKVATSASRRLDRIAQKVAMNADAINSRGMQAEYKSS